ncbi:MAG: ABC transporter ATP-binding protein [Psychrosphaera sp.]|nr:ABC transporter ATP-binding protein [Psychrosphaera sp.]
MKFNNIDKQFATHPVFAGFNHNFDQGKYCITGENGCGKTTLLMMAAGLELPDSGQITFNNLAVTDVAVKPLIGISSDKIIFPRFLTPRQLIEFHCSCYGVIWPTELIDDLHFKTHLSTLAPALSLGNQKKLSLILAMTHQAQCLLLDEPTTGLDSYSRAYIVDYLTAFEGHLIITSHDTLFTNTADYQIFPIADKAVS